MNIGIISERPADALILSRVVSIEPVHRVTWIAGGTQAALDSCAADPPDLILLALPLTETDPTDLVRRLTSTSPCPILIVSDSLRGNAAMVFDAIAGGAFDVVAFPTSGESSPLEHGALLLAKIAAIAKVSRVGAVLRSHGVRADVPSGEMPDVLVAIGASAGGPAAVATLIMALPSDFPAGIVIVQHVADRFVRGMTEWLGDQTGRDVRVAMEGDRPSAGRVLMASAAGHLEVRRGGRLGYTPEPSGAAYMPSVDVFFHSASRAWPHTVVGVLLTGMGKDGALGLKALRERGHHTIAQDEASSAVYGMPKAAVALKAAVEIQPLERIAARLIEVVARRSRQPVE